MCNLKFLNNKFPRISQITTLSEKELVIPLLLYFDQIKQCPCSQGYVNCEVSLKLTLDPRNIFASKIPFLKP